MTISVTSRHANISNEMKAHVHAKLASVLESYPEVEFARAVIAVEKFRHSVEVSVQGRHALRLEAKDESDNLYASVEKVADRLDRRLRSWRDKLVDHMSTRQRTKLADFEQKLNRTE